MREFGREAIGATHHHWSLSQAEIDAERINAFKRYADAAAALHTKLSDKKSRHRTRGGGRLWDAWAGYDTQHFDLSTSILRS